MTQTTERLTLAQFVAQHGITAKVTRANKPPDDWDGPAEADHWRVELRNSGGNAVFKNKYGLDVVNVHPPRRMAVYFSMGPGLGGREPTAADVLDCLASDSAGVDFSPEVRAESWFNATRQFIDYDSWCSEYGYDTDSRKAHRTYTICRRQAERLQKFLGSEAYEQLLWQVDRL